VQLKSFADASASSFVSKSAGVPFVLGLFEQPINEKDIEMMIVVKKGLKFFIFIVLSRITSFRLISWKALSFENLENPDIEDE
tara:strand:- start:499 stop:747 length:249 start_codon:yes stop_codon:yes gene_type:complete